MWTMTAQDVSDVDSQLTTALTRADGTAVYMLSPAERAAILAVYKAYDALLGQPALCLRPPSLLGCRTHLSASYSQVQIGGRLEKLRSKILASADICPYCGFGEPTQLDHYLPKSIFDELAIYPNNLIPSCGPCNNAKRTVAPGLGPVHGQSLIHAYFENLPDTIFLSAEATFVSGALNVSFRIDGAGLDLELFRKLSFQLERLKLNSRYQKQINKYLSEQRTAIMIFGESPGGLAEFLEKSAQSMARSRNFGSNDWRVALLRALASNDDFCNSPELYCGVEDASEVEA